MLLAHSRFTFNLRAGVTNIIIHVKSADMIHPHVCLFVVFFAMAEVDGCEPDYVLWGLWSIHTYWNSCLISTSCCCDDGVGTCWGAAGEDLTCNVCSVWLRATWCVLRHNRQTSQKCHRPPQLNHSVGLAHTHTHTHTNPHALLHCFTLFA